MSVLGGEERLRAAGRRCHDDLVGLRSCRLEFVIDLDVLKMLLMISAYN